MTWAEYIAWHLGNYRRKVEMWEHTRKLAYTQSSAMGGIEITEIEFMQLPFDEPCGEDYLDDTDLNEIFN